ncbi:MAG: hypothetical protein FWG65_11745 [Turicibacter sp.]|nr:hypothetical protein [Turicibacter sp.]
MKLLDRPQQVEFPCPKCKQITFEIKFDALPSLEGNFICPACRNDISAMIAEVRKTVEKHQDSREHLESINAEIYYC